MAQINPAALSLWLCGSSIGFAIGGTEGLAIGLAVTTGLTTLFSIVCS